MNDQNQTEDHILFYSSNVSGDVLQLDQGETRHMKSVLRVGEGDTIYVTDGRGKIYHCRVKTISRDATTTQIIDSREFAPPRPPLDFYVGLPDKKPFETVLETLIPLGAHSITPVVCDYCQSPWWDRRWEKRRDRFTRKMIAAAKQSWNPHLPDLPDPVSLGKVLGQSASPPVFADPDGSTVTELSSRVPADDGFSCFIGPPGGFSPEEKNVFQSADAYPLRLSPYRLRTEHAATVMAAVLVQEFDVG